MKVNELRDFKQRLRDSTVVGPFAKSCDGAFIEILGHAGFDFVVLDLEHGPSSVERLQDLIRAAESSGLVPIVRTKEGLPSTIGEVLDIGAAGVQVPQIRNHDDALAAIQAAKFAPDGSRGVCRFVRASGYSTTDRYRYFSEANEAVIVLQVEGLEAIRNLHSILEVAGIDVVFIGPYDLSQSLGYAGQIDHPAVLSAMNDITEQCLELGIGVGTFVEDVEAAEKWRGVGVQYVCYSVDVGIFAQACSKSVELLRDSIRA